MVYELKRIHILPVIKITFIFSILIGVIMGIFYAFTITFIGSILQKMPDAESSMNFEFLGGFSVFFLIVFFAGSFAIFQTIIIAIILAIYNTLAGWVGGYKIELDAVKTTVMQPDFDKPVGNVIT
jgi:hypothetical protein